jgi:hypothetical protein
MTDTQIVITAAAVISTIINVGSFAWMIRAHCRRDDVERGIAKARSDANSERITELERVQRGVR